VSWSVSTRSASAAETQAVATALAGLARRGDVVVLAGTLGAGKTTFAQGFARGLGVDGPVTSPTFTLVRQYPSSAGLLVHADLYRLEHLAEVADLGLRQLADEGVVLVEWGDVAAPALGPVTWTVTLAAPADGGDDGLRDLTVGGEDADDRRGAVADALARAVGAR
jgi:tRNA threonylcarbamoyl adenosine modification protein YjeE